MDIAGFYLGVCRLHFEVKVARCYVLIEEVCECIIEKPFGVLLFLVSCEVRLWIFAVICRLLRELQILIVNSRRQLLRSKINTFELSCTAGLRALSSRQTGPQNY